MAEQPAVVIATAPLVSPAAALTYFGTPTSPPAPTTRDPLVQEQSRALRYDIDKIFAFVRDNIETTPIFGVQGGGRGVVLNHRGTPFDQAQFMVDALREADAVKATGYNPRYVLGQISLTAAQFGAWFGPANAGQAARLLGARGIPATGSGSGSNFTVVMLHIWVQATVGGTRYSFDPSYKAHGDSAGIAWQAQTDYNQADLLASAGGSSGPTSVSNFNANAFRSTLKGYRGTLETFLAANARGKRADAVVGGRTIVAHPANEDRRTSLPYATSSDRVWTGQIPDKLRASITVALNGAVYGTYFADQVGNQALGFDYYYSDSNPAGFKIVSDVNKAQIIGDTLYDCDQYLENQPMAAAPAVVTIAIDHPYATNGGAYADRTLSKQLASHVCAGGVTPGGRFYVTNDWGFTGSGTSERIALPAAAARADPNNLHALVFGPTLTNVAAQYSRLLDLASEAQGNTYLVHDLIGLHTLDGVRNKLDLVETYDYASVLTMDFEGAVTALSSSNTPASDTGAAFVAGLGLSFVEGSVSRQETDAVYDMSALKLLTEQDARTNPAVQPGTYPIYLATPSTWASVKGLLIDYSIDALAAIQAYVNDGYSILLPQHGGLREPPITVPILNDPNHNSRTMSLWEWQNLNVNPGEYRRSTFMAWHPTTGTNPVPDRVALLVYDPRRHRVLKAGVGVSIEPKNAFDGEIRKPEAPKAESNDAVRAAIEIDGQSGSIRYSPPPDLVDGTGDFPYSLSLQRSYDQRSGDNIGFGIGWKSNWNHTVSLSNDGSAAVGGGGAQALGSALVSLTAIADLASTQDAVHLYGAAQVASWFSDQTINNAATVTSGLEGEQTYYRQADDTLVAAKADGTTLTQTGIPSIGIINRRLYNSITFAMIDREGATRSYIYKESPEGVDVSSPAIASFYTSKTLPMKSWKFPSGINISLSYYNTLAVPEIVGLDTVSNNIGYFIRNSYYDYGAKKKYPTCTGPGSPVVWVTPRSSLVQYQTSSGAVMSLAMDAQSYARVGGNTDNPTCNGQGKLTDTSVAFSSVQSFSNGFTDATGNLWLYANDVHFGLSALYGEYTALKAIYKPSSPAVADVTITQGVDYNARALTDAGGNVWQYFSNPFRSEVLSPSQAAATARAGSVSIYDGYGQSVRQIDPLGRVSTRAYDDLGRVTQVTKPAGDSVLSVYDKRGNVIQSRRRPVGGDPSGSADIVTGTSYVVGSNTATCSATLAPKCNKPDVVTDGRGAATNYAWNDDGTLASATFPADRDGNNPLTTLGYTSFTGTDGAALSLLTSKVESISPGVTTTTTYTRDAANKFSVSAATIDSTGLALRTCTKLDAAGNLISLSDPRQVTCP